MHVRALALALLLFAPAPAAADWQMKPFLGLTFGGDTTFVDLERAAGSPNVVVGLGGVLLGEVIGVEVDFGYGPGFFQSGDQTLVRVGSATTLTGNFVVAWPRRMSEYTLRPYFVTGVGLMHVRIDDWLDLLKVADTLPAVDLGGGATGFLSDRVGLSWDVRRFRSVGGRNEGRGVSFGRERLSFWRATMAVAIRY